MRFRARYHLRCNSSRLACGVRVHGVAIKDTLPNGSIEWAEFRIKNASHPSLTINKLGKIRSE